MHLNCKTAHMIVWPWVCIVVWAGCYLFIMLSHQVPLLRINRQHQNINCNTLRSDIVKCPKIIIRHHYHDQASLSFSSFAFSYYRQQTVAALFTLSSALLLFFCIVVLFFIVVCCCCYCLCCTRIVVIHWFGLVWFPLLLKLCRHKISYSWIAFPFIWSHSWLLPQYINL